MLFKSVHAPIFGALLALVAFTAQAATATPAEVAFWQSVQNSKNPAEYQAYISAFPQGMFVAVAAARIKEYGNGAGAPPAGGAVVGKGIITATPSAVDVGEQVTFTFSKFPKPSGNDWIVVDPAGTPDTASLSSNVGGSFAIMVPMDSGYKLGPFPPGSYEVRWLTTLYNTKTLLQVGARTPFSVNP
jgi:hypothetical protein